VHGCGGTILRIRGNPPATHGADPAAIAPRAHVFAAEQLPWFEVLDDLPRYAGSLRDAALLRRGPRPASG
jgi:hypothetical protein